MKTIEVQLAEAQETIKAKNAEIAKLTESNTSFQKTAAKATLAKQLAESKLPKASQDAIMVQFTEATSDEKFAEAIEFHKQLVKELAGTTTKNLGVVTESEVNEAQKKESKAKLIEGYKKMGMSQEEAEQAAKSK